MAPKHKPNEIHLTREYDAPVTAVWNAFTEPDQVAQWWGPRGFTLTTHSKDLRAGGHWDYTMHGPDGVDYPNVTIYHEVEQYRKLVYDHGANRDRPPLFRVTVVFSESDGRTTMQMSMALATAEEAAATRKFIREVGGNTTWDRLAEYLDETEKGTNSFVINRSFPAPIERVFDLWIDPAHLSNWLPPAGFDMTFLRSNFCDGGDCLFRMSNSDGITFHAVFEFREVTRPSRIVYAQRFCDENERAIRHPGLPDFPESMLTTVLFASEGGQETRVTVTSETFANASEDELAAFRHERTGMTRGWTGSFDKLESLLEATSEA